MDAFADPTLEALFRQHGSLVGDPEADLAEMFLIEGRRQEAHPAPGFFRMFGAGEHGMEMRLHDAGRLLHLGQRASAHGDIHQRRIHPGQRPGAVYRHRQATAVDHLHIIHTQAGQGGAARRDMMLVHQVRDALQVLPSLLDCPGRS